VLGLLLALVFSVQLSLFPSMGFVPFGQSAVGNLRSLTLPALAIALPLFGLYTRFLRGDLLEQMRGEAYIVTASAKGLTRSAIIVRHALRNSLFGLLTIVGVNLGSLIGGTVIIERIFALPGLGQLLLQAINTRDVVVVQAVVLSLAVVTVLASLTVDLLYAVLDPRVRYAAA
jgi:peptide/nickel transport system permease protein